MYWFLEFAHLQRTHMLVLDVPRPARPRRSGALVIALAAPAASLIQLETRVKAVSVSDNTTVDPSVVVPAPTSLSLGFFFSFELLD
jgi:hypothetical protein